MTIYIVVCTQCSEYIARSRYADVALNAADAHREVCDGDVTLDHLVSS